VEITAEDNVYFRANKKKKTLVGFEEMVFKCAGAVVRFKGGNIEMIAPGTISIKFGNYSQMGPASMEVPRILFPEPGKISHFLELNYRYAHNMQPMAGAPYTVELTDGSVIKGTLDKKGHARIENIPEDGAKDIRYGYEPTPMTPWRTPPANPIKDAAPKTDEETENLLEKYLREEQEHLEDNYFPDEIEDMYAPYGASTEYEAHHSYIMSNEQPDFVAYKKSHKDTSNGDK
jgi:type VI secretion system secreted protein VgrG